MEKASGPNAVVLSSRQSSQEMCSPMGWGGGMHCTPLPALTGALHSSAAYLGNRVKFSCPCFFTHSRCSFLKLFLGLNSGFHLDTAEENYLLPFVASRLSNLEAVVLLGLHLPRPSSPCSVLCFCLTVWKRLAMWTIENLPRAE